MAKAIVVGVDGSDASLAALRWAAEEARLRGSSLRAVHAWSFIPPQPIGDPGMLAMPAGDLAGQLGAESAAAGSALESAVFEALGAEPGVEIEQEIVEGDAGSALVAESESAELVVVGSQLRTQGGVARLRQQARGQPCGLPGGRRQSLELATAARTSRQARDRGR